MKLARDEYAKVVDDQKLKLAQRAKCLSVQTDWLWGDSVIYRSVDRLFAGRRGH